MIPKFGDRVTLKDGRVGVVTFVDEPSIRFVKTNDSAQMWTWEPIARVARIHRQDPGTAPYCIMGYPFGDGHTCRRRATSSDGLWCSEHEPHPDYWCTRHRRAVDYEPDDPCAPEDRPCTGSYTLPPYRSANPQVPTGGES